MDRGKRISLVVLAGLIMAMGACTETSGGDDGVTTPVVGNQDSIKGSVALSVDEANLEATIEGSSYVVTIPVANAGSKAAEGTCIVDIIGLDGTIYASGSASLDVGAGESGAVAVTVPVGSDELPQDQEVMRVVRYLVKVGKGTIQGYRSLFVALPKVDLTIRGPKTFYDGEAGPVRVFARNPFTGKPMADLPVTITMADEAGVVTEVEVTTDELGVATTTMAPSGFVDGFIGAQAVAYQGGGVTVGDAISVIRDGKVLVSTDKPFYKPGQTMELRALALSKPHDLAMASEDVTFEIRDGKGNLVFKKNTTTNDFGVASARFQLASEVNMGSYQILARVGETETIREVTVDKYSLPKFKVGLDLDESFYLPGQTIEGTVSADYFFGKAVAAGSVTVTGLSYDVEFTEFGSVTGQTNDEGIFSFELPLPDYLVGQPIDGGGAMVILRVEVVDGAEHLEATETQVMVTKSRIHLAMIPESGTIVYGVPNDFYLFATDPMGNPIHVDLDVTSGGEHVDVVTDDASGIATVIMTPASGEVAFEVSATDLTGEAVDETFSFSGDAALEQVLLRTDKAIYKVGETVEARVFVPKATDRVYFDVIRAGQSLLTWTADIVEGQGGIDIDLDSGLTGDLVLEAYFLTATGQIVRDQKVVFVQDASSLVLDITADKDEYAPAEEATITFSVTDPAGVPKVAAIGVQIVDEAVFALSEIRPGLIETFFKIQEELASPSYQIDFDGFDLPTLLMTDPSAGTADEQLAVQKQTYVALAAMSDLSLSTLYVSSWSGNGGLASIIVHNLEPSYADAAQDIMDNLSYLADIDIVDADSIDAFLGEQTRYFDFWGNTYDVALAFDDWSWSYTLELTSAGPDEIAGTADDFSGSYDAWELMDALGGGYYDMAPMAGGGDWAQDEGAVDFDDNGSDKHSDGEETDSGEPRVRSFFPETLYVNPALITDETGTATVSLTLADSITQWRITGMANTTDGMLGSALGDITVFQEFFVDIDFPATLTRNDEVSFPVAVYNYLTVAQDVTLEIMEEDWFTITDGQSSKVVSLGAGEVKGIYIPVKVLDAGVHSLTVKAYGSTMSDAVMRSVEVVPDGKEERQSFAGRLVDVVKQPITFPADAIPASEKLWLKIYPGVMAQVIEGLDSILAMPSGCFEQTTSTTWPNLLVLDYMMAAGQLDGTGTELELKARSYVSQGYQRLLTFECTGGGFVWFGDPSPANVVLSAIGVMEFSDMAKVHDVDPDVIVRTAAWLAGAQNSDGSWHTDQGSEFATVQYDDPKTTAFVTWALASAGLEDAAVGAAVSYLEGQVAGSDDLYLLAQAANALAWADPSSSVLGSVLDTIYDARIEDADGVHWEYTGASMYGGGGDSTSIEVTAMVALAFIRAGYGTDIVADAIGWLASSKDSFGNWNTTHATILSLKAMVASLSVQTEPVDATVTVSVGGEAVQELVIDEENQEVFHQIDLLPFAQTGGVANDVMVTLTGEGKLMYQLVASHHIPWGEGVAEQTDSLSIDVTYDKTTMAVDDVVTVNVAVTNNTGGTLPMVMIDLGVPPGFDVMTDLLAQALADGLIAKYELAGSQILVYLEQLSAFETLELSYELHAKYPMDAQTPSSSVYLYYDTATKTEAEPQGIEVQ